jgi:hypothetical protein
MPSKGEEPHRKLKEKAIQRAVTQFNIDKIDTIFIEPVKERYGDNLSVATNLFGLKTERKFFPDIVFKYPVDTPVELPETLMKDLAFQFGMSGKVTHKIVVIECEVSPNSHLLRGGLRRIGYEMLKEQYKDLLYLILAKYKDVKMTNTEIFDEIWEFDRD